MKENLSKTITTKLYPVKECLSGNIYSIANLKHKVSLMSEKAEQFIKSYKIT